MPKLIIPGDAKEAAGISPKVIAQYRRFIDRLPDKQVGFLKFSAKEDLNEGRDALLEAAAKSKKYITIRKARGQDRTLQLKRCSKADFDKANKMAKAGAKTPTRRRGRKPGPKPRAAAATAAAPAAEAPQSSDSSEGQDTSPQE
ncbi:MAG: hypothetical protein OXC31_15405 [Spirochaetaceae bacterium]|nr:hypothetical protein [Spirochaetaceae bacterium]